MVTPDEVDDELKAEIEDECDKFGEVAHVLIAVGEPEGGEPGWVKVFVKFVDPASVTACIKKMNNRIFAGRVVKCEVYDEKLFAAKDYSV